MAARAARRASELFSRGVKLLLAEPQSAQLAELVQLVQQVAQVVVEVGLSRVGAHPSDDGIERSAPTVQLRVGSRRPGARGWGGHLRQLLRER
jgi:hypothetical protein